MTERSGIADIYFDSKFSLNIYFLILTFGNLSYFMSIPLFLFLFYFISILKIPENKVEKKSPNIFYVISIPKTPKTLSSPSSSSSPTFTR